MGVSDRHLQHGEPVARRPSPGGLSFCIAHGAVNLYMCVLALCCAPRLTNSIDAVEQSASGSNGPRPPTETQELDAATATSWWWRPGKGRPKIADSSVWEDLSGDAV